MDAKARISASVPISKTLGSPTRRMSKGPLSRKYELPSVKELASRLSDSNNSRSSDNHVEVKAAKEVGSTVSEKKVPFVRFLCLSGCRDSTVRFAVNKLD